MTGVKHIDAEVNPVTIGTKSAVEREWLATDLHGH